MKKILAFFLILIGLVTLFFPKVMQLYETNKQDKLLKEWENNGTQNESSLVENYKSLNGVFGEANYNHIKTENVPNSSDMPENMAGVLEITKINLKLPILEGANQKNLRIGAGHLEGTALPGEVGNSAIAAHRSRTYGRMFNRLKELKPGDKIITKDQKHSYIYQVYEVLIVKPEDLSVLKGEDNERILTLITCDPITTGTHRLIIHAKLIS
ncbi:class D sortase [Paenibacillus sp. BSR1-1]|uniref:class D sortase n=1 Tax=Paenibacillus sp. BSR1-1 TaxID=3020845 RepID=UPI0025B273D1|nr:class D sortase [Paenibacillus sp. BSR1-1]MDN3016062.1 class D sortase [Paenibacillus sp. BSR1-1]